MLRLIPAIDEALILFDFSLMSLLEEPLCEPYLKAIKKGGHITALYSLI
jgi:hypothetical protein